MATTTQTPNAFAGHAVTGDDTPQPLPPPPVYKPGTILTIRMRGHSRTSGQEYWAPCVVLTQYEPLGEIEVLVWDSTAGSAYLHSYPVRDIGVRGDGTSREQFVERSNVGDVLFDPVVFAQLRTDQEAIARLLTDRFSRYQRMFDASGVELDVLRDRVSALESLVTAPNPAAPAAQPHVAGAMPSEAKAAAKPAAERK